MFDFKHTHGEDFLAVALVHADGALRNDRSGIHFRHYEMQSGAMKFGPGFECALVSIEPLNAGSRAG